MNRENSIDPCKTIAMILTVLVCLERHTIVLADSEVSRSRAGAGAIEEVRLLPALGKAQKIVISGDAIDNLPENFFDEAIQAEPTNPLHYANRGLMWSIKGDPKKAMADLDESIKIMPTALAYGFRGDAFCRIKDYERGIQDLTEAIRLNPLWAEAFSRRAEAKDFGRHPVDEVIADHNSAVKLSAQNPAMIARRGLFFQRQRRWKEAINDFSSAIAVAPDELCAPYLAQRGIAFYESGDTAKSLEDLDRSLQLQPNAGVHVSRGQILFNLGRFQDALGEFDAAIAASPDESRAYIEKADTLCLFGDYEAAIACSEKALTLAGVAPRVYEALCLALFESKRYEEALTYANLGLKADDSLGECLCTRARYLRRAANFDEALKDIELAIERAIKRDSLPKPLWFQVRGELRALKKKYTEAIEDLDKVITAGSGSMATFHYRGYAKYQLGKFDSAMSDLNSAIELIANETKVDPVVAEVYFWRGRTHMKKGNFDHAIEDFEKAIAFQPQNALYLCDCGRARHSNRDYSGALKQFTKAIELDAIKPQTYILRGQTLLRLGKGDLSIEDFSKAIELNPKDDVAWNHRGYAWLEQGNAENAILDLTKAIELNPGLASAFMTRGRSFRKKGAFSRSQEDLETAIRLKIDQPAAYAQLAYWLAACPDPAYRNGARAVEVATIGCDLSDWKQDNLIVALAVAYAEKGEFETAQHHLQRAIDMSPNKQRNYRKELMELFKQGQPYRDHEDVPPQ